MPSTPYPISGTIKNSDGVALANATITFTADTTGSAVTGSDG